MSKKCELCNDYVQYYGKIRRIQYNRDCELCQLVKIHSHLLYTYHRFKNQKGLKNNPKYPQPEEEDDL